LRRYLVNRLRGEKDWMADMQEKFRTPNRDTYFYWTAIFGSEFEVLSVRREVATGPKRGS